MMSDVIVIDGALTVRSSGLAARVPVAALAPVLAEFFTAAAECTA
jgi:hypothetical protein